MSHGIKLGDKKVADKAEELANKQMRKDVLPLLDCSTATLARLLFIWKPLRSDIAVSNAYGMKLKLPDKLALQILKDDHLMELTTEIVVSSTIEAAVHWEPKDFVTNILDHLMTDDG